MQNAKDYNVLWKEFRRANPTPKIEQVLQKGKAIMSDYGISTNFQLVNTMEISDFFEFNNNISSSTFQAHSIELERNKKDINDHENLFKGKYERINFPVIFKQEYGKKLIDMLGTGWPDLSLISNRMKKILEENQLTGWKTFPIKLYDKKENEIFGYHGFSIIGRCGPIDYQKAEIIDKQRIPTGPVFKVYKGLYIGLDEWDGTDFFIPDESGFPIISKKAAEVIQKSKTTNTQLKNLTEIEIDTRDILNKKLNKLTNTN